MPHPHTTQPCLSTIINPSSYLLLSAELTGSAAHVGHEDTKRNKGRKGQDGVGVFSKHRGLVLWLFVLLCVGCPESGFVRKPEERSRKHGLFWHYQFRSVFGIVGGVIGHCDMKGISVIMSQCQIVVPLG